MEARRNVDTARTLAIKLSSSIPIQFHCECATFSGSAWCGHMKNMEALLDAACQSLFEKRRAAHGLDTSGVWHEQAKWDEQAAILAHVGGMPDLFDYQKTGAYLVARLLLREYNPETVIDAPCGFGRNIGWLRTEGRTRDSPRNVIAVDRESDFIETVRRNFPDVEAFSEDLATWTPKKPADMLYLQGLFAGEDGPRSLAKNLPQLSHRVLIHESEDEFSLDEIDSMMKGAGYKRTRHHGPYINEANEINTWVSIWERIGNAERTE